MSHAPPGSCEAPAWRPLLCSGAPALGHADVTYAGAPGELTAESVRYGVVPRPPVPNEVGSMGDILYERLANGGAALLGALVDTVREIQARDAGERVGAPSARPPRRATLNDAALAAYVAELADASVPLGRLARAVPYGLRGERLLELLCATDRRVPLDRALWAVRTVGAAESAGIKARSAPYTPGWTAAVLAWLSRLFVAPIDADWAPRWTYACALVQGMRANGLLGEYGYVRWVIRWLNEAPGHLYPCILQLASNALPSAMRYAALSLKFVAALHMRDLEGMPSERWLRRETRAILARCRALETSAFVNTHLPDTTGARIQCLRSGLAPFVDTDAPPWAPALIAMFQRGDGVEHVEAHLGIFLAWAARDRDAICTAGALALRAGVEHDSICAWLDTLDDMPDGAPALLGELERRGVFSFPRFMQRLVARGELRPDAPARSGVAARMFRTMPLFTASVALQQQRRFAIYGARATESHEEASFRRAAREIREALQRHPLRPYDLVHLPHVRSASQYTRHQLAVQVVPQVREPRADVVAAICALLLETREMLALYSFIGATTEHANGEAAAVLCSVLRAHERVWTALEGEDACARDGANVHDDADACAWVSALSACVQDHLPPNAREFRGVQLTACTISWLHEFRQSASESHAWVRPVVDAVIFGAIDGVAVIDNVIAPFITEFAGCTHHFWGACEALCESLLCSREINSPRDFALAQLHATHWRSPRLVGAVVALLERSPTSVLVSRIPEVALDTWRMQPELLGDRPSNAIFALLGVPPTSEALLSPWRGAAAVYAVRHHLDSLSEQKLGDAVAELVWPLFCAHPSVECAGSRLLALAPTERVVRALTDTAISRARELGGDICCIRIAAASTTFAVPCSGEARTALGLAQCETPRGIAFLLALLRMEPLVASPPGRELLGPMAAVVEAAAQAEGDLAVALCDAAAMVQYSMDGDALEAWLAQAHWDDRQIGASTGTAQAARSISLSARLVSFAVRDPWAHAGTPWTRLDALDTHDAGSRDPLQDTLSNATSIPLEAFGMRKTRMVVPGGMAPPAFLTTERSYSDDAVAPAGAAASAKRPRVALDGARKRMRT